MQVQTRKLISVDIDELVGIQQHPAKRLQSSSLHQPIRRSRFGCRWIPTERQLKRVADLRGRIVWFFLLNAICEITALFQHKIVIKQSQ